MPKGFAATSQIFKKTVTATNIPCFRRARATPRPRGPGGHCGKIWLAIGNHQLSRRRHKGACAEGDQYRHVSKRQLSRHCAVLEWLAALLEPLRCGVPFREIRCAESRWLIAS